MKKLSRGFSFLLLFLIYFKAQGQLKTLTGVVSDSTGQIWGNASIRADFAPTPGRNPPFTWSNGNYATTVSTTTDVGGNFTLQLAPNDQIAPSLSNWNFTICPNASTQCSTFTLSISYGMGSNIGSLIVNNLTPVGVAAISIPRAYSDNEITPIPLPGGQYYNTTVKTPRFWDGTQFQSFLGSGAFNIFNSNTLNSDLYPGADVCARIANADLTLGSNAGVITVNISGTCSSNITLSANHALWITAPIAWNATIFQSNNSGIACLGNFQNTTNSTSYLVNFNTTSYVYVRNCTIMSTTNLGATLAQLNNSSHPTLIGNKLTNLSLSFSSGTTDVDVEDNYISGGTDCIRFNSTDRGIVKHNYCSTANNATGGISNFNIDVDASHGALTNFPNQITLGHLLITDNECNTVRFCYFSSGTRGDIVINNRATNCGDTCFDPEGSVSWIYESNICTDGGGNYCYSAYFESLDGMFKNNKATVSATTSTLGRGFAIKNPNIGYQYRHIGLVLEGNTIDFGNNLGIGLTVENQSDIVIRGGLWHNALLSQDSGAQYQGTFLMENVALNTDYNSSTPYQLLNLCQGAGGCLNNSSIVFKNLNIKNTGTVATGTVGIYLHHYDYNNVSYYTARSNKVIGFPTSILYSGDSGNIGAAFYIFDNDVDGSSAAGSIGTPVTGISQGGSNINRAGIARNCNLSSNCT